MGIPIVNMLQLGSVALLVAGGWLHVPGLSLAAAGVAVLAICLQWNRLIPMARILCAAGVVLGGGLAILYPDMRPRLQVALIQGTSFAALMTVLGLLRHPVRQSKLVRDAAEYLIARPSTQRFGAINSGAHILSLLFNVGIIPMIGDLLRQGGEKVILDPSRRALVLATQRGSALVTIWSPVGLGFAVVTSGIPTLDPLAHLGVTAAFTAIVVITTIRFPLLPPEACMAMQDARTIPLSPRPIVLTFGACGLLLLLAITVHHVAGISFTLASVTILPVVAILWMAVDRSGTPRRIPQDIRLAVEGLGGLRNESAIFLFANVIGTGMSILLATLPIGQALMGNALPALPMILGCMLAIPIAAIFYIPNTIITVLIVQLMGSTPLAEAHPLALGLALATGWSVAASLSPISAMCLMAGSICGVSARRVALVWNRPFALVNLSLAAAFVTLLALS